MLVHENQRPGQTAPENNQDLHIGQKKCHLWHHANVQNDPCNFRNFTRSSQAAQTFAAKILDFEHECHQKQNTTCWKHRQNLCQDSIDRKWRLASAQQKACPGPPSTHASSFESRRCAIHGGSASLSVKLTKGWIRSLMVSANSNMKPTISTDPNRLATATSADWLWRPWPERFNCIFECKPAMYKRKFWRRFSATRLNW